MVGLRKLAAIRGLVTHGLRSRVWPLLLGTHEQSHDQDRYEALLSTPHKDTHVVEVDMERSLWAWTEGWTDDARAERRAALKRVLDATVAGNSEDIFYYQGLHDVAAVLLFVAGEAAAYRMLSRLAACHLRDCTRPTLQAAVEVLGMLYPILQAADPGLHSFLMSLDEPALQVPYFALSWHMTWFSHDVASLEQCARLFDLFIASHPLMPLYVAAVALRHNSPAIKASGAAGGEFVYAHLKNLTLLGPGQLTADELAQQAAALYQASPPTALAKEWGRTLAHSTTLDAYIVDGRWQVPEQPTRARKGRVALRVSERFRKRPLLSRAAGTRPGMMAAAAAVLVTGLASAAVMGTAVVLFQLQSLQAGSRGL